MYPTKFAVYLNCFQFNMSRVCTLRSRKLPSSRINRSMSRSYKSRSNISRMKRKWMNKSRINRSRSNLSRINWSRSSIGRINRSRSSRSNRSRGNIDVGVRSINMRWSRINSSSRFVTGLIPYKLHSNFFNPTCH